MEVYKKNSYGLSSRTTAVLFDPWTDMFAKATDLFWVTQTAVILKSSQ